MNLSVFPITAFALSQLLLTGCAGSQQSAESRPQDMLATYQQMANELAKTPTYSTYEPYLSQELRDQMRADFPDARARDEHLEWVAPPFWLDEVGDTYQGPVEDRRCLVLNGVSVEGDPISAAIEYVDRSKMLKIRAVEIALYEPGDSLPSEVWCPIRPDEF